MVMSAARIDAVKRQAVDEAARREHPDGFPALPGVPAGSLRRRRVRGARARRGVRARWLMVAHVDELSEPGDYRLVDQIPEPVVLVRGAGGEVRAFYNTCQHRGAELVAEPAGNTGRRLTCPYHSWVYDLDGALVGYPETPELPGDGPRLPGPALGAVRDVGPARVHQPRRRRRSRWRTSSPR